MSVPALPYLQISAYYSKRNLTHFADLGSLDDRSLLLAQVRVPIWRYFAVIVQYQLLWKHFVDIHGRLSWEVQHSLNAGIGLHFWF